jgi:hypothetical protein
MFSSVEDPTNIMYMLLDFSQENLEKNAEALSYPMKLFN